MNIEFVDYRPEHLEGFTVRSDMSKLQPLFKRKAYRELLETGPAKSCFIDGRFMGCAGLLPAPNNLYVGWMLPSAEIPLKAWPAITRQTRIEISEGMKSRRVVAHIRIDSAGALLWASRLGFEIYATEESFVWGVAA